MPHLLGDDGSFLIKNAPLAHFSRERCGIMHIELRIQPSLRNRPAVSRTAGAFPLREIKKIRYLCTFSETYG